MPELTVLSPEIGTTKEEKQARLGIGDIVRKVVVSAAIHRNHRDLIEEVYLAGLYHGSKLAKPERPRDYLIIDEPTQPPAQPKRRGRPRKVSE